MSNATCSVDGCEKVTGVKGTARGWCSKHYNRWLRNGDPLVRTMRKITETCTIPGCGKPHDALGLCSAHITHLRRHGSPTPPRRAHEVVDDKRVCLGCKESLPTSKFHRRKDSFAARCKPCQSAYAKAYRDARPELIREQARASAAKRPHQRRDSARKRRAALRLVKVEAVSAMAVFDRDGWACGICGGDIPRVTIWPHPLSPSLDHIQAISRGGDHSYSNTQASHLVCNMSKGDRIAA